MPPHPVNNKTGQIELPSEIVEELKQMIVAGNQIQAVKRVQALTQAGLLLSKRYVDDLAKQ